LGDIIEVGGQVRALRWVDGASGALTGSLEGLYEAFRGDEEDGKDSAFVLELASGDLAIEVDLREVNETGDPLPPRPGEHPFAHGRTPVVARRALPRPPSPIDATALTRTLALTVLPDASSGIFAGARGEIVVTVPDYPDSGSVVVHTGSGDLWMDYLERRSARARLQTDLWVDGVRSTGRWHRAGGKLRFTLELHRPNVAVGWYAGSLRLDPVAHEVADRELVETS